MKKNTVDRDRSAKGCIAASAVKGCRMRVENVCGPVLTGGDIAAKDRLSRRQQVICEANDADGENGRCPAASQPRQFSIRRNLSLTQQLRILQIICQSIVAHNGLRQRVLAQMPPTVPRLRSNPYSYVRKTHTPCADDLQDTDTDSPTSNALQNPKKNY